MASPVDQMVGVVPVVVTAGVVTGMTDWVQKKMDEGPILKAHNKAYRREKRRVGKAGKYAGNFRNVGF